MDSVQLGANIALNKFENISTKHLSKTGSEVNSPRNVFESFGQILKNQLNNVNELEGKSENLIQRYAVGEDVPLHQVMMAERKADLAMELTIQMRNKAIATYQEFWRLGI